MGEIIRIDGLRELQSKLKAVDGHMQKEIRVALNAAAEIVVTNARPLVPKRTGRAANSIKAQSQQRKAVVKAGGSRVPYYPWLDFGGAVGKNNSVHRPFIKEGRFLYPTLKSHREEVLEKMAQGLNELIDKAGL